MRDFLFLLYLQNMENEQDIPKIIPEVVLTTPPATPTQKGVIETYAEDMAKAAENLKGIEIKKMIEREEQSNKIEENLSPESKKNRTLMILSGILIIATVIIIFLVVKLSNKIETVTPAQQSKSMIFTDKNQFLPIDTLTKDQIIQTIKNEVAGSDVKNNGIEAIYLTENNKVIGFNRFATLLQMNVPAEVTSYTDDNFLIGTYHGSANTFFILLKVRSFTDIFPGFKIWEGKMFSDLGTLFGTEINADTKELLTKDFTDSIVNNKNARVLSDKDGKTVLEYVYADDTSVVIIGNDETANEVMLRLSAGKVGK